MFMMYLCITSHGAISRSISAKQEGVPHGFLTAALACEKYHFFSVHILGFKKPNMLLHTITPVISAVQTLVGLPIYFIFGNCERTMRMIVSCDPDARYVSSIYSLLILS